MEMEEVTDHFGFATPMTPQAIRPPAFPTG
jgi:hypothetical protein